MSSTEKIFVSPRVDEVFKAIFANDANKPLLQSLISSITGIDKEEVTDLELLNSEMSID